MMKNGFRDKRQKQNRYWETERNRLLKLIVEQQLITDLQKNIKSTLKVALQMVHHLVKEEQISVSIALQAMSLSKDSYLYPVIMITGRGFWIPDCSKSYNHYPVMNWSTVTAR